MISKACSICGEAFECGADNNGEGCWCLSLPRVEIVSGADCRCPNCLSQITKKQASLQSSETPPPLIEGIDYYLDEGLLVFTELYHLKRGYCCENNCRHCPFKKEPAGGLN